MTYLQKMHVQQLQKMSWYFESCVAYYKIKAQFIFKILFFIYFYSSDPALQNPTQTQ